MIAIYCKCVSANKISRSNMAVRACEPDTGFGYMCDLDFEDMILVKAMAPLGSWTKKKTIPDPTWQ